MFLVKNVTVIGYFKKAALMLVSVIENPDFSSGTVESKSIEYGLDGVVKNDTAETPVGPLTFGMVIRFGTLPLIIQFKK